MLQNRSQKILVFLDIDGTLIGYDQQPTTDVLKPYLKDLETRGVRFGLNSNRAHEDIIPVIEQFGLTGPFIIENGACVVDSIGATPEPLVEIPYDVPALTEIALRAVARELFQTDAVEKRDTTHLVIAGVSPDAPLTFFMNIFRRYSASIHHRVKGEYHPHISEQLAQALNAYFLAHQIHLSATAHAHGATVTIDVPGVDKGTGLKELRLRFPDTLFVAIGDGGGDIPLRPFVDRLYAVNNAIPELKAIADRVATQSVTQGVLELLQHEIEPLLNEE